MDTDDGGWTVFQRRQDGSQDFYLNWANYTAGFGDLEGEFWLGLDKIHRLAPDVANNTLRVDLEDLDNAKRYAKYSTFSVSDSNDNYKLTVGGYSGDDSGDSLAYQNGMAFTTKDRDNDSFDANCAVRFKGAWWYKGCHHSNLNGLYGSTEYGEGLNWYAWHGHYYSLPRTEMKVRQN